MNAVPLFTVTKTFQSYMIDFVQIKLHQKTNLICIADIVTDRLLRAEKVSCNVKMIQFTLQNSIIISTATTLQ